MMEICVLGCGVSGLTTGLALLRAGHGVRIWAKALPPETTSNVAAAIWYPYKALPIARVTAWGATAYRVFSGLAGDPATGVMLAELLDLKRRPAPDPEWKDAVDDFRRARKDELLAGFADGYVFTAPVIDTSRYLDYLLRTFRAEGGQVERRAVRDVAEALAEYAVAVNCTGLGARELVGDGEFRPLRGQVVRVRHRGTRRALLDGDSADEVTYIVPRISDMVLGGTDDEGNESTEPDPAVTRDILRRCARLDPSLADLSADDILGVAVGIRPVRSTVRLEAEHVSGGRWLLHNYGHGGAGVTLSWGCADEVARLVEALR
jgi:D-amino-acid oxidase